MSIFICSNVIEFIFISSNSVNALAVFEFCIRGKKKPKEIMKKISVCMNIQIIPERCSLSHRNSNLFH